MSNVLRLDERRVTSIMTPRQQFYAVDLDDPVATVRARVAGAPHTRIVVCRGGTDNVLGIVEVTDLLADVLTGQPLDVASRVREPLRVPETATTTSLIATFREQGRQVALVMDEYGEVQGLVTDSDFLGAIVGDIGTEGTPGRRESGCVTTGRGWSRRVADRGPAGRARLGLLARPGGTPIHDGGRSRAAPARAYSAGRGSLRRGGLAFRSRRHGWAAGGHGAGKSYPALIAGPWFRGRNWTSENLTGTLRLVANLASNEMHSSDLSGSYGCWPGFCSDCQGKCMANEPE